MYGIEKQVQIFYGNEVHLLIICCRRMNLLYLALVQRGAGDNQMHRVSAPHSPTVLPLCNNKCQLKDQFAKMR